MSIACISTASLAAYGRQSQNGPVQDGAGTQQAAPAPHRQDGKEAAAPGSSPHGTRPEGGNLGLDTFA